MCLSVRMEESVCVVCVYTCMCNLSESKKEQSRGEMVSVGKAHFLRFITELSRKTPLKQPFINTLLALAQRDPS